MKEESQQKITLVQVIENRLREFGWKPAELARRSGVSAPVLSRLFNGGLQIGLENVQKILFSLDLIDRNSIETGIPHEIEISNRWLRDHKTIILAFQILSLESQLKLSYELMGEMIAAKKITQPENYGILNKGIKTTSKFIEERISKADEGQYNLKKKSYGK